MAEIQDVKKKKIPLDPAKVEAFGKLFSGSEESQLKRRVGKLDTGSKARIALGEATSADSTYLEQIGFFDKDIARKTQREKDQTLYNLSTNPTKKDSTDWDQQHPGAVSIFEKKTNKKVKTPEQRFKDRKFTLGMKVANGSATDAEKEEYRKLVSASAGKGSKADKPEGYDKTRERYMDRILGAENIMTKEKKSIEMVPDPDDPDEMMQQEMSVSAYSQPMIDTARQTATAYTDSVKWLDKANIVNRNLNTNFTAQELEKQTKEGIRIARTIMQAYKDGELQKRFPMMTDQGLRAKLPQLIDDSLKRRGIVGNHSDMIKADQDIKASKQR